MGKGFSAGEESWRAGLGTLRQVVRQELVTRQLAAQLTAGRPMRVLDVGCGQGTQVLALARAGHRVTGVDSSATLLGDLEAALAAETASVREQVRLVHGEAERLADLVPAQNFDAVLCHGVLMYFADPAPLLTGVAAAVAPGGFASLLVRNGDALAMRPGLLGHWPTAQRAFDDMSYGNRIGVTARADRLADLTRLLAERGLSVDTWFGVRVFTDTVPSDAPAPAEEELRVLLDCEERAGSTDPYRGVAALVHVIARRVLTAIAGRAALCQTMMSALPVAVGGFGRPGPGPARSGFTPRRRRCRLGPVSGRRGGVPGLSTASSSAPRSLRRGRCSRSRGRC